MSSVFHIDGIENAIDMFDRQETILRSSEVQQIFKVAGDAVAGTARELVRVYNGPPLKDVTPGELRDAIFVRAYSKDTVPYVLLGVAGVRQALPIEFGNDHNAAFPFMRPAIDQWEAQIGPLVEQSLSALFG
jgi:hypothetical protein